MPPAADYLLEREGADPPESWRFAVNFRDARESDLRSGSTDTTSPPPRETSPATDRYAESPASRILLLLLLAAIAADWWILRGRRAA